MSKHEDKKSFLQTTLTRYDDALSHDQDNRSEALDDLKFRAGEQWHPEDKRTRETEGRPVITINRMPAFVKQIMGDMRQNRPSIKVRGVDDNSDPELAETLTGLIRNIENESDARVPYMVAADAQVTSGIGHWRVVSKYADDDTFEQDLRIEAIRNPFSVVWDPASSSVTREDAQYCFVIEQMTTDQFDEKFPDAKSETWPSGDEASYENQWRDADTIKVAEYWLKSTKTRRLAMLDGGRVVDVTEMSEAQKQFLNITREEDRERTIVERYLLTGGEILEGPEEWPGKYIPIVPLIGEEVDIGDRIVRHGIVRYAKDSQRLYNYWRTANAEQVALQPKAPYIGTAKQFERHKGLWNQANTRNLPYLPYDSDAQAPPPQRQPPPVFSSGMAQEIALAAEEMKATTGIFDAALGNKSNETSGKAILARQRESDVGSFVYFDNFSVSIAYTGRIIIDLIPHFYDTERVVRVLGEDDAEEFVRVNQVMMGPDGPLIFNDLTLGKYDVTVTSGPSYSTRRAEAADSMLAFVQAVPGAAALVADLLAQAQDWPDADKFATRLKKALPPGLAEEEDGEEQEQAEPDPAQVMAEQVQQVNLLQVAAQRKADTDKKTAEAALTAAKVQGQQVDNAQKAIDLQLQNGELDALIERVASAAALAAFQQAQPPPTQEPQQFQPDPASEPGFLTPNAAPPVGI